MIINLAIAGLSNDNLLKVFYTQAVIDQIYFWFFHSSIVYMHSPLYV